MAKHSKTRNILLIILGILLILVVVVWCLWRGEIKTIATLKQVGENPYLYYMEYKADYDLEEVIEKDLDQNPKLLDYVTAKIGKGLPIKGKSAQVADENGKLRTFNCTSLQARNANGEGYLYGRNYDYFQNPTLVTLSHPKTRYASLAVSDMSHFGYSLEDLPTSFTKKLLCLASIYAPVDGINEAGLCTSIMALHHQPANQQTGKHSVGTSIIMRLWLDRCATVEEALNLLSTVDIRHDSIVGSGYHYMVADAKGDCAIVEFDKDDGWKQVGSIRARHFVLWLDIPRSPDTQHPQSGIHKSVHLCYRCGALPDTEWQTNFVRWPDRACSSVRCRRS